MTVENLRSYPVYFPGQEPDGYWEKLQHVGPQPLIDPEKLKTEADWIKGGPKSLRGGRSSTLTHFGREDSRSG